jgi:class 3 adenylate cyclase
MILRATGAKGKTAGRPLPRKEAADIMPCREKRPAMSESNPTGGKRTLAAIVFTDIVDYSARMEKKEDQTLRLAQRDLGAIREICNQCEGKVLKTTGDGLLMYFDSALQAVACAMRAQAHFTTLAKKIPPDEQLQHRIGIHLGDVFVSDDDVMGDGVNVAARLQAEAVPGGICVSQTVYDVVKNRLGVKVIYLGPRELKNIREAVPVYQILLDAAAVGDKPVSAAPRGNRKTWVWATAGAAAVLAAAGVGLALWYVVWRPEKPASQAAAPPASQVVSVSDQPTTRISEPQAQRPASDRPEPQDMAEKRREFLSTQDFQGFVDWLESRNLGRTRLAENYRHLARFKGIVHVRLMNATKEDPIQIFVPEPGGRVSARVWPGEDGGFWVKMEGQDARKTDRLPPGVAVGVYEALAQTPPQRRLIAFLVAECRRADFFPTGG